MILYLLFLSIIASNNGMSNGQHSPTGSKKQKRKRTPNFNTVNEANTITPNEMPNTQYFSILNHLNRQNFNTENKSQNLALTGMPNGQLFPIGNNFGAFTLGGMTNFQHFPNALDLQLQYENEGKSITLNGMKHGKSVDLKVNLNRDDFNICRIENKSKTTDRINNDDVKMNKYKTTCTFIQRSQCLGNSHGMVICRRIPGDLQYGVWKYNDRSLRQFEITFSSELENFPAIIQHGTSTYKIEAFQLYETMGGLNLGPFVQQKTVGNAYSATYTHGKKAMIRAIRKHGDTHITWTQYSENLTDVHPGKLIKHFLKTNLKYMMKRFKIFPKTVLKHRLMTKPSMI